MVDELRQSLQRKSEELAQQKSNQTSIQRVAKLDAKMISNGGNNDVEKELLLQYDNEKKKCLELQGDKEELIQKLNDLMDTKQKYISLKKEHKSLKQITKDELSQHIAMQKSIEAEAIYLAATNANLVEQNEDLLNLLDQRDYELTMLNQQLTLQRTQRQTRKDTIMTLHSEVLYASIHCDIMNIVFLLRIWAHWAML